MIRSILSAISLGTALVCAMPAFAQDMVSVHVGYGDLNLASTAGAAMFERRIDAAVTQICGRPGQRDLTQAAVVNQCRREVSSNAQALASRSITAARAPVMASMDKPVVVATR